ncbi:MAG: penicillin acylase family protein [Acidobacteriota bacterium]
MLLLAGAVFVFWRLRAPLPDTTGTLRVEGLRGRVEIVRDVDAIPHIRAGSEADALFALGYTHAQERLWQMEFQRRAAQGRLAEILGPAALKSDRLLRTVGVARAAALAWPRIAPDARAQVEAYVAGINSFLSTHRGGSLPIEFAILRTAPDLWRGEDVLACQKSLAWLLSVNWSDELLRVRLSARVGDVAANLLMPAYTPNGPVIVQPDPAPDATRPAAPSPGAPPATPPAVPAGPAKSKSPLATDAVLSDLAGLADAIRAIGPEPAVGGGSNSWVVAGSRTTTGKPLLANDPHLGGQAPSTWYLAHLTGGQLDVIGATVPGMPGVIIGHNQRIAWGITALLGDTQDLFVERINTRDEAEYDGAWEPMTVLRDIIKVRGEADVPMRVRITRHGPILSDVLDDPQAALALRWTGLDVEDHTIESFARMGAARTWPEFVAAMASIHTPLLNFIYADVDGNIGYYAPGAHPVRTSGDGARPVPGWTSDADWRGYVHETQWPKAFNPSRGFVVTANNKPVPDSYPFRLGSSWEAPYRAARITELIQIGGQLAADDLTRMQRDVKSAQVAAILPFLLTARPTDPAGRAAMDRLRAWDGTVSGDSPDAALFEAWYEATARGLFEDDLGEALFADYWSHRSVVAKAIDTMIQTRDLGWCDDVRTLDAESCETLLGQTLQRAMAAMGSRQGSTTPSNWRWDRVNAAEFPHMPFDAVPWLRRWFSRSVPRGGDPFTVTPVMPIRDRTFISSYRQIIDLASIDASRFIIPMGQSGHVWSGHYADLLEKWNRTEYLPMRFSRSAVDDAAGDRLVFEPR